MDIEIIAGGKSTLASPQQRWTDIDGEWEVMQVARFAGQEMIAITDDAGAFDLLYLGFAARGFPTMEAAKAAAPEFAKRVLGRMLEAIIG
ncbi:hypothetical protein [Thiomonas sp.]